MPFDPERADLIIQYALLLAGEEEDWVDRQLGPIHLIKYVYLADLAHARHSGGESFTGADWRFHKFGPWDAAVYERVEPASKAIHAEQMKFDSRYGDDDWIRYRLRDSRKLDELEKKLPPAIKISLPREVHQFLGDTPSLLDHVYKTDPMLKAAPQERLDLTSSVSEDAHSPIAARSAGLQDTPRLRLQTLSRKKQKKFHERVKAARKQVRSKPALVDPVKTRRYDEVYEQGVSWLDTLAGPQPSEEEQLTAEFSDDTWYSKARRGEDVS